MQLTKKSVWLKVKMYFQKMHGLLIEDALQQNKVWYVYGSLILGILGVIISLYTLLIPVENIKKNIEELQYDFPKVFNDQLVNTSDLTGEELVKSYYSFVNSGDYQSACSLLSIRMCSLFDVGQFTEWVKDQNRYLTVKLRDGETLEKVWFSNETLENTHSEIWCGKIKYEIGYEDQPIQQIMQYTIADRPDGGREIRKRLCESASKNGENRSAQMGCNAEPKLCINSEK